MDLSQTEVEGCNKFLQVLGCVISCVKFMDHVVWALLSCHTQSGWQTPLQIFYGDEIHVCTKFQTFSCNSAVCKNKRVDDKVDRI